MKLWQAFILFLIITAGIFIPLAIYDFITEVWWIRTLIMIAAAAFDGILSIYIIAWMDNKIFIDNIKKKRHEPSETE